MADNSEQGKGWYFIRSIWVIFLFFPFALLTPFVFFYVGKRASERKWIIAGFVYLVIVYGGFAMIGTTDDPDTIISDIGVGISLGVWMYSIAHGFSIRPKYLRKLYQEEQNYTFHPPQQEHRQETTRTSHTPTSSIAYEEKKEQTIKTIYINEANEAEIAQLPSIPPFLAKKIIEVREQEGPYKSIEHLGRATQIRPHILMRSKQYIMFSDEEKQPSEEINHPEQPKKQGRIVDY